MGLVSISAKKVKEMIDNDEFDLIIDLRNKENYEKSHLTNSINIPINEITDMLNYLEKYKERSILLYCGIGHQSKTVGKVLVLNGFSKIYTLSNGINDYKYNY